MTRVIVDTNVLISGLMGHGLCTDLFDILVQDHEVVLCQPVLAELERLLRDKFRAPAGLRGELRNNLRREAEIAAPAGDEPASPDPDDVEILRAARSASADWFVTGDKPRLGMAWIDSLPIVSPRKLWDLLEGWQG